ncbi:Beta-galactosidase [Kribbella flavida DSM 17836]|uniref:Beta-galactosidase n=1 Tax=Kribbella flavida (strain DSM 17836 / JCM 10339 / NBRC 14399) TaxID=479435 RepID=D2PS87_KRIFD|nr:beta-galactosidase family protein [Kribbella flavida]ADB31211.1 Beta-galactosidase [Kribbella flavida DSM 17836]
MSDFAIGESDFLLDGEPFRILSGALHYFRVHPDLWADRIDKARRMGLNTIETYVPWNAHSPRRGVFDTDGMLDLGRFLEQVAAAGLYAIVRPGPYICAEWDNGGLPAWLFQEPGVGVRRYEPRFLAAVEQYLEQVLDLVRPLQVDQGGPVLLLQVENEYGAFGNDPEYLEAVAGMIRKAGITVPLVTVDQPTGEMLAAGGLDGVLRTGSFGSRSAERLATLREHQPTGPLMCMEFWDGWFDHWGGPHHTTSVEDAARELDALLAAGASVNIYMFHGGTNFGLTSGADDKGVFRPTVTSYDYDAPLDEAGRPTAKYHAFREVLSRYSTVSAEAPPAVAAPAPQFSVPLGEPVRLLTDPAVWGPASRHATMPTLDDLGARLALFRTELDGDGPVLLSIGEVRDRALVFLDGDPVGVLERDHRDRALMLPRGRGRLEIVVEDQGRVNYGPRIGEVKGLLGDVQLGPDLLTDWSAWTIDLDAVPALWDSAAPATGPGVGPTAWRTSFAAEHPVDHFLGTDAWGKGIAWVNGFCLGRYWHRGPQHTLYVPAPLIRSGDNDLVVLELETMADPTAHFVPDLSLGPVES